METYAMSARTPPIMKNDTPIKLSVLIRERKKKFPFLPVQAIQAAAREGLFDSVRSSKAKKARYYVLPRELDKYLKTLGFAVN